MAAMNAIATPSAAFWRGRKVLLTGHTGFKGSWLALWLLSLGAEVVGLANGVPTERSLFDDVGLGGDMTDVRADVRDLDAVTTLVRQDRPSVVLHLAAQPLVRLSYDEPVDTYATNVMGTVNVLEAVRRAGDAVELVLIVTSDKCYENREWIWGYRETDAMGGHDPYSSSKGCAEIVASAYARSYFDSGRGTKVVSARAGNVFGGGDWALDRLIPDLVRGFEAGTPVEIRHPDAIRPWQHVLEPLSGYLVLCEQATTRPELRSQGWNFGPDAAGEVTVRQLADAVCSKWPRPDGWVDVSGGHHRHEAHFLTLDSTKARSLLGWRPRWSLGAGLEATLDVYRSSKKGQDLKDLVVDQIERYAASGGATP